jgi:hypothetical protein
MDKEAQIMDALRGAGDSLLQSVEQAPDQLSQFWANLSPERKRLLMNSLIGAAIGGTGGATMGALSPESSATGSGLMGALLGGLAGAGGTAGYGLLSGRQVFPGEVPSDVPVTDKALNEIAGKLMWNPATAVGGTVGGVAAAKGFPTETRLRAQLRDLASGTGKGSASQSLMDLAKNLGADPGATASQQRAMSEVLSKATSRKDLTEAFKAIGQRAPSRIRAGLFPAGLGAGYLVDRYLKGEGG